MSRTLYPMLAALATTTYAVSLFAELYRLGFCRMAVQFADCGLSPDAATGSRRGVSPWLILAAMPPALVGVIVGGCETFGMSIAGLGLIWHTHLMVFACVAYRMFNNMGCWEANMATTLVIPTGARGEFARAMRALVRFLFRGAGIVKPPPPKPNPDEKKPKPLPWWWWISLIFGMSARLILFGTIPSLVDCGGDAGMLARRKRALYLIELMKKCKGVSVSLAADGSFFIFFQPNTDIPALTGFWPTPPRSVDELGRIGHVDLAHPTLMNQIPAYATADDATTGALSANREGSWRRNQLRLEAGVNVPACQGLI